ncbi:MAG: alpha/beta fold hydrolase [Candidatus Binatia bacterium]
MPDVKANGLKIHYVEEGSGEAVVFVHGLVMDHTMYAAQFEDLPDQFRCIALDLRGHGRTECPPGPWSMQDSVDDVIAFIEAVDAAPCHFVGMSWGGMIGARVAVQRPELLRSLVLIDTSIDADGPEQLELERGFREWIEQAGLTDEVVAAAMPVLFGERYRADETAMAAYADRVTSMKPEAVVEGLRAVMERGSVTDRVGTLAIPVLVIHGEADAAQPVSEADKTAGLIPGARLVRLPGVGHTAPLEAPDEVNAALADFLTRSA